jgi:hypothetical protein
MGETGVRHTCLPPRKPKISIKAAELKVGAFRSICLFQAPHSSASNSAGQRLVAAKAVFMA